MTPQRLKKEEEKAHDDIIVDNLHEEYNFITGLIIVSIKIMKELYKHNKTKMRSNQVNLQYNKIKVLDRKKVK